MQQRIFFKNKHFCLIHESFVLTLIWIVYTILGTHGAARETRQIHAQVEKTT